MLYEAELYYPETERPVVRTFEARCHTEAANMIQAEVRASRQEGNPISHSTVSVAVERDDAGEIVFKTETKKR